MFSKYIDKTYYNPDFFVNIIKNYSESVCNCLILYQGEKIDDVRDISRAKIDSKICVVSRNTEFLKSCKLFYGIQCFKLDNNISYLIPFIKSHYGNEISVLLFQSGDTKKITYI